MERVFENDLVSVIIPVYNCELFLSSTIDSVLAQDSEKKLEIIIVNDCSSDNSEKIIQKYIKKHSNIFYFKNNINLGAGESRNIGLSKAKGRFVAFVDADDLWKSDKIKKQLRLLQEKNAFFSYTAIEMIDKNGKKIKNKRKLKTEITYSFLLKNTMIANSSVLIDRNILGDFKMSTRRMSHDYSTWLRLLRNGSKAYGVDEALVSYRVHSSSLSSNKLKSAKYIWDIQKEDEGLSSIHILFNIACWSVNSILKYFF